MRMRRRQGFTLIELLVVIAIITLLMGILLPALAKARAAATQTKDASQLSQIHKAMTAFARQFEGKFPRPGLINRLEAELRDGSTEEMPGRGPEDHTKNNTQNMYSACIAQNYFNPNIIVSPSEPNGRVIAKSDYNQQSYQPNNDMYWDGDNEGPYDGWDQDLGEFGADLGALSNTSYAHCPFVGKRGQQRWKDDLDSEWPMFSNRGVINGALPDDGDDYADSLTLQIHGGRNQWVGNVCFADGHVESLQTFLPDGIIYYDPSADADRDDNLFAEQTAPADGSGTDRWLVIYTGADDSGDFLSELQWD